VNRHGVWGRAHFERPRGDPARVAHDDVIDERRGQHDATARRRELARREERSVSQAQVDRRREPVGAHEVDHLG